MIKRIRRYFLEIIFLAGQGLNYLPLIFLLYIFLGLIDLLGIGLIGQYVGLILGVTNEMSKVPLPLIGYLTGQSLVLVGILLVSVFLLKAILGVSANFAIFQTVGRIEVALRTALLRSYQTLPYEEWAERNSSEYINAVNVWAPQYARLVLVPLIRLGSELVVAILIFTFLFMVSPLAFGVFICLIGGATFIYDRILRRRNQSYAARFRAMSSVVITDVRQALDGIKEIRVLGAEKFFSKRIENNASDLCGALAMSNTISGSPRFFLEFSLVLFASLIPLAADHSGSRAVEFMPIIAMFGAGALRLVSLFSLMAGTTTQLGFYRPVVHQLYKDLLAPSAELNVSKIGVPSKFLEISVNDLYFKYRNSKEPILKSVSLSFQAGQSVAIIGPSGSGKSTLVDLLLGILKPTSGSINVSSQEHKGVENNLGSHSVYLPQTTFLIDDTIRRNVALGIDDIDIDDQRVLDILRRVHMLEFIERLPLGLDTEVGDRGHTLSGGQRQRIALARALYLGRTVLFLDEATSAIDLETEMAILADLLDLHGELTLILITHRAEVANQFDKVFQVTNGAVVDVTDEYRNSPKNS